MKDTRITHFYQYDISGKVVLPLYSTRVSAGFPSPADDFVEQKLDLNEHLIQNPVATFLVRVDGESMIDAGIRPGSILVVDRSKDVKDGSIIVAVVDGEFTVKRIRQKNGEVWLMPENNTGAFEPLQITGDVSFEVWGVVTSIIQEVG